MNRPAKIAALTAALVVGTTGTVAVANSLPPADPTPPLPGRTVKIPTRPCVDANDYDWCYWDARRNPAYADFVLDPVTGEKVYTGEVVKASTRSYWAYSVPGPQPGTEYVCITYLPRGYDKDFGGCGLVTTNDE